MYLLNAAIDLVVGKEDDCACSYQALTASHFAELGSPEGKYDIMTISNDAGNGD